MIFRLGLFHLKRCEGGSKKIDGEGPEMGKAVRYFEYYRGGIGEGLENEEKGDEGRESTNSSSLASPYLFKWKSHYLIPDNSLKKV